MLVAGCMVRWEFDILQVGDYRHRTNKDFILEKTDFYAILLNKLLESIVYTTPRTARRSKWTD
jgi:hypothetical protein